MVEFALVSVVFLFLVVLTLNAIIAFSVYQYVSYAAFLSARALQAGATSPTQQNAAACSTLAQLLPGLSGISGSSCNGAKGMLTFSHFKKPLARINRISIPDANAFKPQAGSLTSGTANTADTTRDVIIQFEVDFLTIPLSGDLSEFQTIAMTAKSSLGREVTQSECLSYFENFLDPFILRNKAKLKSEQWHKNMDDNGC